jgi:hypothetical protein
MNKTNFDLDDYVSLRLERKGEHEHMEKQS